MRRCYARISTAVNPLRRETPKSPWSRWIGFSAPSGHFRIVLFLIGLIGCLCLFSSACRSVYWFFFSFSVRLPFPMVSFFGYWGAFCVPSVFSYPLRSDGSLVAFVFRRRFFHWGFHVVRPSPGFLYRSVRTRFMALFFLLLSCSSFVFVFLFPSFSFASIAVRPFRLRSPIPPLRITSS